MVGVVVALTFLTGVESVIGLNPFYYWNDGTLNPVPARQNAAGVAMNHGPVNWIELAHEVHELQKTAGASLVVADSTDAAAALSFYLPNNPTVYLVNRDDSRLTQFDFWAQYWDSASAGDSIIFVTRSSDDVPDSLKKDFQGVSSATDQPVPDAIADWHFWKCEAFQEGNHGSAQKTDEKMSNQDALPK